MGDNVFASILLLSKIQLIDFKINRIKNQLFSFHKTTNSIRRTFSLTNFHIRFPLLIKTC